MTQEFKEYIAGCLSRPTVTSSLGNPAIYTYQKLNEEKSIGVDFKERKAYIVYSTPSGEVLFKEITNF